MLTRPFAYWTLDEVSRYKTPFGAKPFPANPPIKTEVDRSREQLAKKIKTASESKEHKIPADDGLIAEGLRGPNTAVT